MKKLIRIIPQYQPGLMEPVKITDDRVESIFTKNNSVGIEFYYSKNSLVKKELTLYP